MERKENYEQLVKEEDQIVKRLITCEESNSGALFLGLQIR